MIVSASANRSLIRESLGRTRRTRVRCRRPYDSCNSVAATQEFVAPVLQHTDVRLALDGCRMGSAVTWFEPSCVSLQPARWWCSVRGCSRFGRPPPSLRRRLLSWVLSRAGRRGRFARSTRGRSRRCRDRGHIASPRHGVSCAPPVERSSSSRTGGRSSSTVGLDASYVAPRQARFHRISTGLGESASSAGDGPRCSPSTRTTARATSGTSTSTSPWVLSTQGAFADSPPQAVTPHGMLVWIDNSLMLVQTRIRRVADFLKPKALHSSMFGMVVVDVLHDRAFVISRDGTVAQVDRISTTPRHTTHHVDLNGRDFRAAWAGQGKIAVWGQDGLGTIDTRTWTTQSIDAEPKSLPTETSSVISTPYGIVSWAYDAPGVRVYRPDGSLRFTVLADENIKALYDNRGKPVPGSVPPVVVGRYLYIVGNQRTTIDLAAGRVVGPARLDAKLAAPSYVPIP